MLSKPEAVEVNDVAGMAALVLDEAAPTLGEHVALAGGPVQVPELPHLAHAVFLPS